MPSSIGEKGQKKARAGWLEIAETPLNYIVPHSKASLSSAKSRSKRRSTDFSLSLEARGKTRGVIQSHTAYRWGYCILSSFSECMTLVATAKARVRLVIALDQSRPIGFFLIPAWAVPESPAQLHPPNIQRPTLSTCNHNAGQGQCAIYTILMENCGKPRICSNTVINNKPTTTPKAPPSVPSKYDAVQARQIQKSDHLNRLGGRRSYLSLYLQLKEIKDVNGRRLLQYQMNR